MKTCDQTQTEKRNLLSLQTQGREWYESDLQLAAELGKTLLERNQELEDSVRQQQIVIEEQAQEIEFLTRQTSALREANDSRLKIYEQLEVSVAELEKANQQLQQDSRTDKRKIQSFSKSIDILEKRCEELQDQVEELTSGYKLKQWKNEQKARSSLDMEEESSRLCARSSPITNLLDASFSGFEESPYEIEISKLKSSISRLKCQLTKEQKQREEMQLEMDNLVQENGRLQEELLSCQERERQSLNLQMEMDAFDDRKMCPVCRMFFSISHGDSEVENDLMETDHCSLIQLKNGVVVYGEHGSLADQLDNIQEDPPVSLLSELDAQYRVLIKKYESMVDDRCRTMTDDPNWQCADDHTAKSSTSGTSLNKCEFSSLSMTSDAETVESSLSSGFSESMDHLVDQSVQTDPAEPKRALDLNADDPLAGHFNHGPPEYKKLFAEIFAVLKKSVNHDDEEECSVAHRPSIDAEIQTFVEEEDDDELREIDASGDNKPSSKCQLPGRRKLHSNAAFIKFCELEKIAQQQGVKPLVPLSPFFRTGFIRAQSPGSMTYAEAVRKGRALQKFRKVALPVTPAAE